MASTFAENKKMKPEQSPCQSWFKHIGIEKSNSYSVQFFTARRKTKTSSKSDETTDPSTTGQDNGQDSELMEDEPKEESDPDLPPLRSSCNELCLVYCDKCDYVYAPQAFKWHQEARHSQEQDEHNKDILYQHRLYKPKTWPVPVQENKKRKRKKNVSSQNENPCSIDDSEINDSQANVVQKLDVMSGPGHGKRKRKRILFGKKRKRKQPPVTHCESFPMEIIMNNQSTNSMDIGAKPQLVNNVKISEANCSNSETRNFHCEIKLDDETGNILCKNNLQTPLHSCDTSSKVEISPNPVNTGIKLNSHLGSISPISITTTNNQNVIEKVQNGTPPIKLNGNLKKKSAQGNLNGMCCQNLIRNASFHNENEVYLENFADGSKLQSRKRKLKSEKKREKLKTALASPVCEQYLQTIRIKPIKIKKALSSVNSVCRTRTIERFRTFSHLKRIRPCDKNFPPRTRVSCSVNTSVKSACKKSWNKVPFRYQSRKRFLQVESGLILSDSPFETLRNTFNQNELVTSPIQFEEGDFVNDTTTSCDIVESTLKFEEPIEMDILTNEIEKSTNEIVMTSENENPTNEMNILDIYKLEFIDDYGMPTNEFVDSTNKIVGLTTNVLDWTDNIGSTNAVMESTYEVGESSNKIMKLSNEIVDLTDKNYELTDDSEESPNKIDEGFTTPEGYPFEGQQSDFSSPPSANSPWDSDNMCSNKTDSGYCSQHAPDQDGSHQLLSPISNGSPNSPSCDDNTVHNHKLEEYHADRNQASMLLMTKELNGKNNGLNGIINGFMDQSQGYNNR